MPKHTQTRELIAGGVPPEEALLWDRIWHASYLSRRTSDGLIYCIIDEGKEYYFYDGSDTAIKKGHKLVSIETVAWLKLLGEL